MRSSMLSVAAAVVLAAGAVASAQSLSTGYTGAMTFLSGADAGNFFNIRALNTQGITITGFDGHSQLATAGSPVTAHVYVKQGPYQGFETNAGAWTLLGTVETVAGGQGVPTPVPIGDLYIPEGETYGIRLGFVSGGARYNTAAATTEFHSNADVEIQLGAAQGSLFTAAVNTPRGWNGTVYYDIGNTLVFGACCLPSGACEQTTQNLCTNQGGTYNGDNTDCATIPPCPQPPTGACCLPDGSCAVMWEPGCLSEGGLYQGDGTDCISAPCPLSLTTQYDGGSSATVANAGVFFDLTADNPSGLIIEGFQTNSPAAAGTALTMQVWTKPGSYVGSEQNQAAWTMLGEVATVAAGLGQRTSVPIGGLHIAQGETYGVRMTAVNGGHRYNSAATTTPVHSNADLTITLGAVQNSNWGSVLSGTLGWNGTVFYDIGAVVTTGACCFLDGSCSTISEAVCLATDGVYNGDGTDCATTNCPQPGACCLPSGCFVLAEIECTAFGGEFRGGDCATANCPPPTVANLIGFNFTTATSTTPDPQNWNRIGTAEGSLANVMDDTGVPTPVGIEWGGSSGGFTFLATSTLAANAVPQHAYDLSGMTGYGFRSSAAPFTITLSGLSPNTEYQYWFVGYRATSAIENDVFVSQGDTINAINFQQIMTSAQNNGNFIVNETIVDNTMHWDTLSFTTTSSSTGTLTFNWNGLGTQTTVIGALAIREIFGEQCYPNCDGSTVEPILNVDDFTCFINEFALAQTLPHEQQITSYPNCDESTIAPVLNVDDFTCFINSFALGCQ